jgi:hypothetical protein
MGRVGGGGGVGRGWVGQSPSVLTPAYRGLAPSYRTGSVSYDD